MSVLQRYHEEKQKILDELKQAKDWGWLNDNDYKVLLEQVENNVLTIGVVGQMKAGKSTFLNAFIFEKDVLPSATTPMTAALSVITYGERERLVAEFYSEEDWEEQKHNAAKNLDGIQDELSRSKIQAAQELVKQSRSLGGEQELAKLLGKTQEDKLENLVEYVGAEGRYVSITKSVRIEYPKEYLKGVEIVDTPGFNDPIVSREERTKDFLRRADVVLLMLYAGRPFDETDREILLKHIGSCGVGRLAIGLNKYDVLYEEGQDEEEIVQYIKDEIEKICDNCEDESLVEMMKGAEIIPISAQMALLSYLSLSDIKDNESYSCALERYDDMFEGASSKKDLLHNSHFKKLEQCVQDIINKEKEGIVLERPRKQILAAGRRKESEYTAEIARQNELISNLSLPNEALEEKLIALQRLQKRISKHLNNHSGELDEELHNLRKSYEKKFRDAIDDKIKELHEIVKKAGRYSYDRLAGDYKRCSERLVSNVFPTLNSQLQRELRAITVKKLRVLATDIEGEVYKRMEEFSPKGIVTMVTRYLQEAEDNHDFAIKQEQKEEEFSITSFLWEIISLPNTILSSAIWGNKDFKEQLRQEADSIKTKIDLKTMLKELVPQSEIFTQLEKALDKEVFASLRTEIEDIQANKANRESQLATAQQTKQQTESKLSQLREQRQSLGL